MRWTREILNRNRAIFAETRKYHIGCINFKCSPTLNDEGVRIMHRPGWFTLRSMGLLGIAVVVGAPSAPAPSQARARQCNLLSDTDPNSPDKKNPILTPIDASTKNAILTSGLPCAEVMTDQG